MVLDCSCPEALASVSTDNLIKGLITEQDGNVLPGSTGKALLELPAHGEGLSWRSSFASLFPDFFMRPRNSFPKGSAFVLAAIHILLPRSPLGLRLPLPPLLLLVPPLPPHVPCLKYNSTHNDPVKKTQVICLRSTLHTRRHSQKQLKGDVGAS